MTLNDIRINESVIISAVAGGGALRQHFLDMGVIPGAKITLVRIAPMGDPLEFRLHGYELTLRKDDAKNISVIPCEETDDHISVSEEKKVIPHPGLGETGKFHPKGSGDPLPDSTVLTFALVGNQNSGKTTLFNQLTGANQHVGNFPGVTVDRKDGQIRDYKNTSVTDLPGIYSMSPYSSEELVSRDFVLKSKPHAIINIVDSTNIERNMYLTMQLLEMDIPVVVALNMMDELTGNGGMIYVNKMEAMLGTPVVPISAAKNQGITELIDHAIHIAKYQEKPLLQDFCSQEDHGGAVHRAIHAVRHLIEDHAEKAGLPVWFAASKLIEGDKLILEQLGLDRNEQEMLEHIVLQMETERGLDASAAMADMRFAFIAKICDECVVKPKESKEHVRSQKIDRVLMGKYTAIPIFILIMAAVFFLTFNVIGALLQDLLAAGIEQLALHADHAMTAANINEAIHSLVIEGIFEGVGSVLSFLPIIITMFFFLSIMEDSGYIARVAFVMDQLLRKLGLSGRSIVPMLIGFGCTVPAVMSARTLPSERDRKMTILLTPFMSCTAKLPIYAFFVNAFFPGHKGLIMTALYVLGILCSIIVAFLFKKTLFRGEAVPFVMELPNYRMPGMKNVIRLLWDKAKDFLQRAFTVIMLATIIVWFLQSFDFRMRLVESSQDSMLAVVAGWIAPIFKPLGFGSWEYSTALITGFIAKESVVSTLGVIFGSKAVFASSLTVASALSILVFCLLYTPCVAAIAAVRRELGSKWAMIMIIAQCLIAWICAFIVHLIASVF